MTDSKKVFVLENGLVPKNPLDADNGLGWTEVRIKWFLFVISDFFLIALFPHKIKTTGSSFSFTRDIILSVKVSQPIFLCELAWLALTVNEVLRSKTHYSVCSSLNQISILYIYLVEMEE